MKRETAALTVLLGITLLWYLGLTLLERSDPALHAEERQAARTMAEAIRVISREASDRGFPPDPATDPNHTGLIGLPFSAITTTLGSLPAKRTGAQPEAAALLVRLLREAGVHPGDRIAVDSSGSFPGFAIAALVAGKTLGAETISIVSIGASTYGANRPQFTLADMLALLVQKGVLPRGPVAVSPGGASDAGGDMDGTALEAALARARKNGAQLIRTQDLAADIAVKHTLLGTPRALVSVGGNWASAGTGEGVLGRTGLLRPSDFAPGGPAGTGLIQSYLREGVPVIRILDVQDLCARTGLPYDPIPWPEAALGNRPLLPRPLLLAGPILALLAAAWVRFGKGVRITPNTEPSR
jgi:poly-gamma-glutamate system protein